MTIPYTLHVAETMMDHDQETTLFVEAVEDTDYYRYYLVEVTDPATVDDDEVVEGDRDDSDTVVVEDHNILPVACLVAGADAVV